MSTPLDHFKYKNGVLMSDRVNLVDIADAVGTPVYVYSAEAFLTPLEQLQKGLKPIPHLICFAVKSNSNIAILKMLSEEGAGMDLVSGGELFRAERAGVPGDRIVFSGVGKTPGEMAQALSYRGKGIASFNVESLAELFTLNAVAMELGKRAPVALRFNPDVDPKTHPYISTGLKKNKFGMSYSDVMKVVRNLEAFEGIELKGMSIHIGSQLVSLSPLNDAFKKVQQLILELESLMPQPFEFLDLGGGVGIAYKNEKPPRIDQYCSLILKYFGPKSSLVKKRGRPLKIVLEPGRRISGNSGVLLTEVLYRKERGKKDFLVVDAAMNDLMRPSLYGSYHEIVPVEKNKTKGKTKKTDIVGPVCESGDCFATDRVLSESLDQGDLVAILSAGAYGFSMASNYNSRPRPPEVLVRGGKFRVIRERENYEQLVAGEKL